MIRRTLLIGRQEFVKYVTRRGFIISLLMFPVVLVLAITIPRFTAAHPRTNVMTVVDRAGGYAHAIFHAAARDQAKAELMALSQYAKHYADLRKLGGSDPALADMLETPGRLPRSPGAAAGSPLSPRFRRSSAPERRSSARPRPVSSSCRRRPSLPPISPPAAATRPWPILPGRKATKAAA